MKVPGYDKRNRNISRWRRKTFRNCEAVTSPGSLFHPHCLDSQYGVANWNFGHVAAAVVAESTVALDHPTRVSGRVEYVSEKEKRILDLNAMITSPFPERFT